MRRPGKREYHQYQTLILIMNQVKTGLENWLFHFNPLPLRLIPFVSDRRPDQLDVGTKVRHRGLSRKLLRAKVRLYGDKHLPRGWGVPPKRSRHKAFARKSFRHKALWGFVHPWEPRGPRKVDRSRSGAYETVAGPPRVLTSHHGTGG